MTHRTPTLIPTLLAALLTAGLAVQGCSSGGSSSGGSATPAETGEITVAVTDAATDEIDVFEVDVTSFRFERDNGAVVEVLPQRTRIDFAELVSVSEVIAAAQLPVGTYRAAFMTLDFSGAAVRITGNGGAATLQDGNGASLTGQRELQIMLPNSGLVVGARRGYFAEVDFDLDQSLVVDAAANTVQVDTVLYATIDPAQPKPARVPGLASNYSGAQFELDVRRGLGLVSRGTLTVLTSSTTTFDLGTSSATGSAGFASLAALGSDTLTVAQGVVDPRARTLTATHVAVLPQNLDEVAGLVVARSGGAGLDTVLTLRGVAVSRAGGSVTFNTQVTLNASFAETQVHKRGQATTTDAINVGQRIVAYGTLSGSTLDLTAPGAGFVRLLATGISGAVTAPPSGSLTLDAARIGRRTIGQFDFDVDGVAQLDADALVADTGSLGLAGITSGSVVIARGFFDPVSATPSTPDFSAETVIDRTNTASLLRVWWLGGSSTPFAASGVIDVSQATTKILDQGLVVPTTLTSNPTLQGDTGLFAVRRGAQLTLFNRYADFLAHVEAELQGGRQLIALRAIGAWDSGAETLSAQRAFATVR